MKDNERSRPISNHILPTAATMVGVCMTVISIVKLIQVSTGESWLDEILTVDTLLFLASAFFSYLAIRKEQLGTRLESMADLAFMLGLGLMALSTIVLTFALI
jgi:hypothetical protein